MKNFKYKKILIITGLVLAVVVIIVGHFMPEEVEQLTNLVTTPETGIVQKISKGEIPKSETITISDIEIGNFYKGKAQKTSYGDVLIETKDEYHIIYHPENESFLVSVLSSPFETVREKAEEVFLKKLGITINEACKLDVSITTPRFINPIESGKIYGLSFCE